jgi:hypothetical protein
MTRPLTLTYRMRVVNVKLSMGTFLQDGYILAGKLLSQLAVRRKQRGRGLPFYFQTSVNIQ